MKIADIKQANESAGFCFFSRNTLKFFGQRMRGFRAYKRNGKIFVYNPYGHYPNGTRCFTFAEFVPKTGDVINAKHDYNIQTISDAEDFLGLC